MSAHYKLRLKPNRTRNRDVQMYIYPVEDCDLLEYSFILTRALCFAFWIHIGLLRVDKV